MPFIDDDAGSDFRPQDWLKKGAVPVTPRATNAVKVLACDRDGFALHDRPDLAAASPTLFVTGWVIYLFEGDKYLQFYDPEGNLAAELFMEFKDDNSARIKLISSERGSISLGTARMRSFWRLLHKAYPNIETLIGTRISGARRKSPSYEPMEIKRSLRLLAGRPLSEQERVETDKHFVRHPTRSDDALH